VIRGGPAPWRRCLRPDDLPVRLRSARRFVAASSVSLASAQARKLVHFAASPLPRTSHRCASRFPLPLVAANGALPRNSLASPAAGGASVVSTLLVCARRGRGMSMQDCFSEQNQPANRTTLRRFSGGATQAVGHAGPSRRRRRQSRRNQSSHENSVSTTQKQAGLEKTSPKSVFLLWRATPFLLSARERRNGVALVSPPTGGILGVTAPESM